MVRRKENKKFNLIKLIGLLLFACGMFMIVYNYSTKVKLDENNDTKIEEFFDDDNTPQVEEPKEDKQENTTTSKVTNYNYIAVLEPPLPNCKRRLEIPSINLKRGLVVPSSKYNNVNYNIQIIDKSSMPDVVNGNLVLASHNGASYISFFKNLYKLNNDDKVYVYYNGYKYEYSISKIYDTSKDGHIEVYRDNQKTTITLITCKKNTKDTQTVYIGYLTNKVAY